MAKRAGWMVAGMGLAFVGCLGVPATEPVDSAPIEPGDPDALEVKFLGVGGFLIRSGGDAVMTAPLYSNPDIWATTVGGVSSDREAIDRFSAGLKLDDVRAILSGHAHYDHLMDVPYVWAKTPNAWIVGNMSTRHLLAAYAPDRGPECDGTPVQPVTIPRWRVVAMDAPWADNVDGRLCGDPERGGSQHYVSDFVRIRALCSEHPDQVGPFHFGAGSVDEDQCEPPRTADDWREGETLAFLIDFMDPLTGAVRHRVYYQDAPTSAPIGHVPADVLAEKAVDVALLCVGTFAAVHDHPTEILRSLAPRYAISGHWEDFFQQQDKPIKGVPFHDLAKYRQRAESTLADHAEAPVIVDGVVTTGRRHWMPNPGTQFVFPSAPAPEVPAER